MQNEIKITRKAWIEALKSGKYKQGQTTMQDLNGNNCCLGVACRVAGIDLSQYEQGQLEKSIISQIGMKRGQNPAEFAPDPRFVEIERQLYLPSYQQDELAALNDGIYNGGQRSFEQIADLLIFDSWLRGITE